MAKIRMAQYGTKHGHAGAKMLSMVNHPAVEIAGVFEPDPVRRQQVATDDPIYRGLHWYNSAEEMLTDPTIVAIASEGLNRESLDHTEAIVDAGKHVWYDKPAGDNWPQWQRVIRKAAEKGLLVQMGYMFRYHHGFRQLAEWTHSGVLGDLFSVRAHMSTWIPPVREGLGYNTRDTISYHKGGIFYDLGGHMLDQVVWLLGRPTKVTAFLRNDTGGAPTFMDNTLGVFEFEKALAFIDIAAMETRPMARRFEVYGTKGSAILVEPFEPTGVLRLCLEEAGGGYAAGLHLINLPAQGRQDTHDLELVAFLAAMAGEQAPDRPLSHELLVQETLLRATGGIPEGTKS
ncbi:MAG: Gfo/Idh/MocA family oxidoreductase [Caldilineaceae bacterium]|nr:Gfo/Idh/MocA family oxidoreductase [Caldilineaceae bacterium]